MSDEIQSEVKIDPNAEITPETQLILMNQWKQKVEKELADYTAAKDVIAADFKRQKERFDKILAVKIKKMKKYDVVMNSRKKVLQEIVVEIGKLTTPAS
jgi:cytidylate kinase